MTNLKRTDTHRPSAIEPTEYEYVAVEYTKDAAIDGFGSAQWVMAQRELIEAHMKNSGGTYAAHQHGGSCMVCGAMAIYTAIFYHKPSNTYVRTGQECAGKLGYYDAAAFRSFRANVKMAREAKAGKMKAEKTLADAGLAAAWVIYTTEDFTGGYKYEEDTINNIIGKLVKYGSISEKQVAFITSLLKHIDGRADLKAKRAAEKDAASPAPTGRVEVEVEVLKVEWRDSEYGGSLKMTVKASDGWVAWGTAPGSIDSVERGDRLTLKATFTPSDNDPKFAFFKRPVAKLVTAAAK